MDRFFMCDDGSWPIHSTITDQMTDGIDTFAIVVIHESEHVTMFNTWWKRIYQEMYQDSKLWNKADKKWTDIDSYFAAIEPLDGDGDRVLDSAEKGIPKSRGGPLNPEKWDTYGYKTDDQEYLAAKAQKRWTITSADHEDWSKCGKQWTKKTPKECPEIGKYIPR